MMGRGLPSWYKYRAFGPVHEEIRLAEHAARTGSIIRFDRRGDLVWLDDFESGMNKWEWSNHGTNAASFPFTRHARSGGLSAQLVAGSDGAHRVESIRDLPYPAISNMGFEISFKPLDDYERFFIDIAIYDGSNMYRGTVQHDQSLLEYQIWLGNGAWVKLATAPSWQVMKGPFHTIKIVVDFNTMKYKRAIFDDQGFDLSAYDLEAIADATNPRIHVRFVFVGRVGYNDEGYVDDAIVTQNEP